MQIGICEDEPLQLEWFSNLVRKELSVQHISGECDCFDSAEALLAAAQEKQYDLFFLDIVMPGIQGFELAERLNRLRPDAMQVFVTSQEHLVLDAFQVHPFGFIPKSRLEYMLPEMLRDAWREYCRKQRYFHFSGGESELILRLAEITYLECYEHDLYIHTLQEQEAYRRYGSLRQYEEELCSCGFIRIHKNYLVNREHVLSISGSDAGRGKLQLRGGISLPVSRYRREAVKKGLLGQWK